MSIILYDIIITDDLNLNVVNQFNVEAHRVCSILDSQGLTQHVKSATDNGGPTR